MTSDRQYGVLSALVFLVCIAAVLGGYAFSAMSGGPPFGAAADSLFSALAWGASSSNFPRNYNPVWNLIAAVTAAAAIS
jgi:hypothetical protein